MFAFLQLLFHICYLLTYLKAVYWIQHQHDSTGEFGRDLLEPARELLHQSHRITGQWRGIRNVLHQLQTYKYFTVQYYWPHCHTALWGYQSFTEKSSKTLLVRLYAYFHWKAIMTNKYTTLIFSVILLIMTIGHALRDELWPTKW